MKKSILTLLLVSSLFTISIAFAGSSGPSGGPGGGSFYDVPLANEVMFEIKVRHGAAIDSVETIYKNTLTNTYRSGGHHGGWGGSESSVYLMPGEYPTAVWGYYGNFGSIVVDRYLAYRTNFGRTFGGYGQVSGAFFYYDIPSGSTMKGFKGRSGALLDAVGVNW